MATKSKQTKCELDMGNLSELNIVIVMHCVLYLFLSVNCVLVGRRVEVVSV